MSPAKTPSRDRPSARAPEGGGAGSTGPPKDVANRKLIRPRVAQHVSTERPGRGGTSRRRAPPPPEVTGAEHAHYAKQANLSRPMIVTLIGGEVLRGVIEWHDRDCLRLRRTEGPDVLVMKHAILHTARDLDAPRPRTGRRG